MSCFIDKKNDNLHNYKLPIVSLGIIPFTIMDNKIKFLMIRRKDSVGYIDFIRGKYILFYKNYIQNIVDVMTISEKKNLLTKNFNILWKEMWGDTSIIQYRNEEKHAKDKLKLLKDGVHTNYNSFNLEDCINDSSTYWKENEWGFPKGRKNYQEKDLACAIREFEEETGIHKNEINIITNIHQLEETFIGSNLKCYKHKYYIAYIKNPYISLEKYQRSEVSKIEWKTYEECINIIRDYHHEKKNILKNINNMLLSLRLIL